MIALSDRILGGIEAVLRIELPRPRDFKPNEFRGCEREFYEALARSFSLEGRLQRTG